MLRQPLPRLFLKHALACAVVLSVMPAIISVGILILAGDLLYRVFSPLIKARPYKRKKPDTTRASIVVLNWNGRDLLARGLPSVLEATRYDGEAHELIVVDNGSTDGSVDFVRENFPSVKVVALERNVRFTGGNNAGVKASKNDIVVFLNNDMVVDKAFLRPLLEGFEKEDDVFAISSQVFFWDETRRREETGKTRARFEKGTIEFWHEAVAETNEGGLGPAFWGGGGSCAWDRDKYLELGGLDTLYDPFYLEDTDLSYRAWKRGWKVLFAPDSKVYHKHRGTNKPIFGDDYIERAIGKNRHLFFWRNITDLSWIIQHFLYLPYSLTTTMVHGKLKDILSFLWALKQFPEAFAKRHKGRRGIKLSDEMVFKISSNPFYLWRHLGMRSVPLNFRDHVDFNGDHEDQLGAGWGGLEGKPGDQWRWMGYEATVLLKADSRKDSLEMKGFALLEHIIGKRIKIKVCVNGKLIGAKALFKSGDFTFLAKLPPSSGGEVLEVKVKVNQTFNPKALGLSDDARNLSIAVRSICLK